MFRKTYLPDVITRMVAWLVFLFVIGSVTFVQEVDRVDAAAGEGLTAQASSVNAVPGGPGFVAVNASAFTPAYSNTQFSFSGFALYTPTGYSGYFYAPLAIPNGSTITKFVVYFYDNSPNDFGIFIKRVPLESNQGEQLAYLESSYDGDYYRFEATTDIYMPVVDLQSYSYVVETFLPGDQNIKLANVRVDYAFSSQLPMIQK